LSFVQYGFEHDTRGKGLGKGAYKDDQVILLVLNNHTKLQYEICPTGSEDPVDPEKLKNMKDKVCILWPKNGGPIPDTLSPEHLFHFKAEAEDGEEEREWPHEYFELYGDILRYDTALVYKDPTKQYTYEYGKTADGVGDDYRFKFHENAIGVWLWEQGHDRPEPLLDEKTVRRVVQAQSGGAQKEGGALPYPPG
jgi:hypothetical protein